VYGSLVVAMVQFSFRTLVTSVHDPDVVFAECFPGLCATVAFAAACRARNCWSVPGLGPVSPVPDDRKVKNLNPNVPISTPALATANASSVAVAAVAMRIALNCLPCVCEFLAGPVVGLACPAKLDGLADGVPGLVLGPGGAGLGLAGAGLGRGDAIAGADMVARPPGLVRFCLM
jgi:hypothetical protein